MTKKLLLFVAAIALTCSVSMAAIKTVQPLNQEFIKNNFGKSTEQAIAPVSMRQATQKATETSTQLLLEDFEGYDTQSLMPDGWVAIDNSLEGGVFCTNIAVSTSGGYAAFSGESGLASMYNDDAARDGWAIAPGVELEAGHTYHFGIYAFCMGYNSVIDEWTLTIGNAQTVESQTTIIIDRSGDNAVQDEDWTLCTGSFTPAESGTYYVAIHHCTQTAGGNIALWDYLQIDSDHIRILPQGSLFSKGGLWSLDGHTQDENGNVGVYRSYLYEGESLQYGCVATNCTSVEWDFGQYGTTADNTAAQPVVTYNFPNGKDEIYNDVFLIMQNEDGESYALREFYINRIGNNSVYSDFISNIRPEDGFYLLGSSSQYDALCGLNSAYTRFAERYVMNENVSAIVSGAYIIPLYYNLSVINRKKEFTVRVLNADENGMPGSELYSEKFKFQDIFGNSSFQGANLVGFGFAEDVAVKGTFFIEFEFPSISVGSNNYIFYATTQARPFADDNSSYFYNPTSIEGAPEGWYSSIDYYGAGISSAIYPLVTFQDHTSIAAPSVSDCTVYANGSELNVVNAQLGSDIVVTDIAGRVVLQATANSVKTTINTNLNAGIYVVTVNGVSTKIAIR